MIKDNNTKTLEELITPISTKEKENKVKEFSKTLCEMISKLYESYNVLRQDPIDETQRLDGSLMVFQSRLDDTLTGEEHQKLFKLAFDYNINIFEANKQFKKDVQNGNSIKLGDVVVTDTALSNVLSSNELNVSITFMLSKDYEEKKRIEEEEKEKLDKL
ncbi:hypothetical protein RP15_gp004 [Staphylococcus phage vB_Sau-RP15]|nr:hypothetical protein RP15_gp004 [Staphylococcus phage vB_Sau-RP15]